MKCDKKQQYYSVGNKNARAECLNKKSAGASTKTKKKLEG